MNNKIIKLDDITIENITKAMLFHSGEPFATSTQIAKYFAIAHNDLLKKIRSFYSFNELKGLGKISQRTRTLKGREYPYFELDADAFSFICLSIAGKKAEAFKWVFIQAYKKATIEAVSARVAIQTNKSNKEWVEARDHGKDTRKLFMDKVKEFCLYAEQQRGSPYKFCPYYKLVTDAIYAYLDIEVPKGGKTPRDVYSGDNVEAIEAAELEVIELLDDLIGSKESRKGIKKRIATRLQQKYCLEVQYEK